MTWPRRAGGRSWRRRWPRDSAAVRVSRLRRHRNTKRGALESTRPNQRSSCGAMSSGASVLSDLRDSARAVSPAERPGPRFGKAARTSARVVGRARRGAGRGAILRGAGRTRHPRSPPGPRDRCRDPGAGGRVTGHGRNDDRGREGGGRNLTRRERFTEAGRCTVCGRFRDRTDRKRCARCRVSQCDRDKKTHSTAAGRARVAAQRRARLLERRAAGTCTKCGRQRDRDDRLSCQPCRHSAAILTRRRIRAARAAGGL